MKTNEDSQPSVAINVDSFRRNFFAQVIGGAALAAGIGLVAKGARAQSATDAEILNFALNLEYLEAEFYSLATTGQTLALRSIALSGVGTQGQVLTKAGTNAAISPVTFTTPSTQQFAAEVAQDELNHVLFLRSTLGSAAVAEPAIDLYNSFNAAYQAASGNSTATFDPFANEGNFLLGAYIFEDVGVTAYQGASSLIQNKAGYLPSAAGILAVEAYHAGSFRTRIIQADTASPSAGLAATANLISAARAKLDGTGSDDIGVGTSGSYTVVDDNVSSNVVTVPGGPAVIGGTFPRTTSQVLSIVYLGGAAGTGGGFFPAGMNGAIR